MKYLLHDNSSNKPQCLIGRKKEGNGLFNDTLNTFYLQLYGVRHIVKDHSDSKRGNYYMGYTF